MLEVTQPKYVSPFERGYSSYHDHLIAFNRQNQEGTKESIRPYFEGFSQRLAILTTGSDARLEKGPESLIELIFLVERDLKNPDAFMRLNAYITGRENWKIFDPDIELKNIFRDDLSKCVLREGTRYETHLISPNRILDGRVLFTTEETYEMAMQKFAAELQFPEGKSLLKKISSRVKEHSKISLSGKQIFKGEEKKHYDLEGGVAFYEPSSGVWGFKQGPLRTVQYALVRDAIKFIRQGGNLNKVFSLPKNTVGKLNSLEVEGMSQLSPQQLEDLTDSYKYFLHLYHKAQTLFKQKEIGQTEFDPKETKERCKALADICREEIFA